MASQDVLGFSMDVAIAAGVGEGAGCGGHVAWVEE